MYSVPPGYSSLRLPLGDFVVYPTDHPSMRTLVCQIADLGYSVEVYLFPHNNFRALPPGDRHWAVVIGDAILVIVPPSLSSDSPGDSGNDGSSGSMSGPSRVEPYYGFSLVGEGFLALLALHHGRVRLARSSTLGPQGCSGLSG